MWRHNKPKTKNQSRREVKIDVWKYLHIVMGLKVHL